MGRQERRCDRRERQEGLLSESKLGSCGNGRRLVSPTWTEKDHRPTLKVDIYRMKVSGPTDASVADLVKNGTIKLEKVKTVDLPRKPEWLGW